jgi:hypothetical protein
LPEDVARQHGVDASVVARDLGQHGLEPVTWKLGEAAEEEEVEARRIDVEAAVRGAWHRERRCTASTAKKSDVKTLAIRIASGQRRVGISKRVIPTVRTIEHTVIMMLALVSAIDDSWFCVCWIVRSA